MAKSKDKSVGIYVCGVLRLVHKLPDVYLFKYIKFMARDVCSTLSF